MLKLPPIDVNAISLNLSPAIEKKILETLDIWGYAGWAVVAACVCYVFLALLGRRK